MRHSIGFPVLIASSDGHSFNKWLSILANIVIVFLVARYVPFLMPTIMDAYARLGATPSAYL